MIAGALFCRPVVEIKLYSWWRRAGRAGFKVLHSSEIEGLVVIKDELLAFCNRAVQEPHREDSLGGMEHPVRFAPRREETTATFFCGEELFG